MSTRFNQSRRLIIVRGDVQGPIGAAVFRMVLDTGSTRTVLDRALSGSNGTVPDLNRPVVTMESATGVAQIPQARIHRMRSLEQERQHFDVLIHDYSASQQEKNVPIAILLDIGLRLQDAWRNAWVSDFHLATLERTLSIITDVQGGCERTKNTPIPFAYTVLLHRTVAFYCLFLPFGIINTVGWLTPLVVALISHAFLGLDEIGSEIVSSHPKPATDLRVKTGH